MRSLWPSTPSALLPKFRASSPHPTYPFLPNHEGVGGGAPPALPAPPTAPTWSQARPLLTDPGASRPGLQQPRVPKGVGASKRGCCPPLTAVPLWSGRRKPPRRTSLIAAAAARAVAVATGRICSHAPAPSQLPGGSGEGPSHPRPSRSRFPPPPTYRCSAFPGLSPPTPDRNPAPLRRPEPLAQTSPRPPSKGQVPHTQKHLLI